ncbi:MAG: hypothetical protein K2Z81_26265 [Cyanobacteria bacterium]|nr:hypothetical protein [Cyanobacteriota bacterium]
MNSPGPVELTVNTKLADPNSRRQIIDPIKDLMHKAQIPSLVMNDEKSHATWTYTVQVPLNENKEDDNPLIGRAAQAPPQQQYQQAAPQQQYQQQAAPQQQQYQQAAPQQQYQQPAQQQQPAAQTGGGESSIDQIYNEERNGDYSQYKNVE